MESIDQRNYFKEMNKFNTDGLSEQSMSTVDSLYKNRPMTKGTLSEYQHSYFNLPNDSKKRHGSSRPKDSFSFGNKSMLQESFILENISKKFGDEKNQSLTNSWYKDDYNYLGQENMQKALDETDKIKTPYNPLNAYKQEYIKNFEEMNSGLVDNYSLVKGGTLLQLKSGLKNSSRNNIQFSSHSKLPNLTRNHDLRSIWVPKKFEGRNMFVSHIDSMIFPDKSEKDYDSDYYKNYEINVDAKKKIERASYDKIDKSVQYVMNHESRYVPSLRWYPPQKEFAAPHQHTKDDLFDSKSIYQADYEKPFLVQTQKITKPKSGEELQKSLDELKKRRNEIDFILARN